MLIAHLAPSGSKLCTLWLELLMQTLENKLSSYQCLCWTSCCLLSLSWILSPKLKSGNTLGSSSANTLSQAAFLKEYFYTSLVAPSLLRSKIILKQSLMNHSKSRLKLTVRNSAAVLCLLLFEWCLLKTTMASCFRKWLSLKPIGSHWTSLELSATDRIEDLESI